MEYHGRSALLHSRGDMVVNPSFFYQRAIMAGLE
jgi:hypothetical protein